MISGWRVKIVTYHQLGQFRDAEDWKWMTFNEPLRVRFDREMHRRHRHPQRNMALYPPGVVRQKWLAEERRLEEQ